MIGVFAALDALLFYFFWEAMLIPMFLIIGVWGGPRRVYATLKFFLYTFLGSVFMLVALIYLYLKARRATRSRPSRRCRSTMHEQMLDLLRVPAGLRGQGADVCRCTRGCRTRTSRRRPAAR